MWPARVYIKSTSDCSRDQDQACSENKSYCIQRKKERYWRKEDKQYFMALQAAGTDAIQAEF